MKQLGSMLLVSLGALGCRSPTQITFDVSTNVPCATLQGTTLTTGPIAALTDGRPPTTSAPRCTTEGHIGSLVVVPSGDDDDLVAVKIVTGVSVPPDQCGAHGEGCIVAKRALRYLPQVPLTVSVPMDLACEGVECDGELTCVSGVCESGVISNPAACEGSGCGESALGTVDAGDGSAPIADAGAVDATLPSDASIPLDGSVEASGVITPTSIGVSINFACRSSRTTRSRAGVTTTSASSETASRTRPRTRPPPFAFPGSITSRVSRSAKSTPARSWTTVACGAGARSTTARPVRTTTATTSSRRA